RPGPAVSRGGTRLYLTEEGENRAAIIDPPTDTIIDHVPTGNDHRGIAVPPSGSPLYVANFADGVWVHDTTAPYAHTGTASNGGGDAGGDPLAVVVNPVGATD